MISIVICSIDGAKFDAVSEQYRQALGSEPYEIIRIPDARSMCDGYNRGLDISTGDIVIFSHDDLEIWTTELAPRLKAHLQNFDVVGVAGTNRLVQPGWISAGPPHVFGQVAHGYPSGIVSLMVYGLPARVIPNIQAMDGLFLAFRRPVIQSLRWDHHSFTHFHCYDIDCTYRAFRAGYRLAVANDIPLLHMSGGSYDELWFEQATRLANKHGIGRIVPPPHAKIAIDFPSKARALEAMTRYISHLPA